MKVNNPFFSILIPTYNREQYLNKAIVAILKQTFKNFEIVISDNNSSDSTREIVLSFKDSRIKYIKNAKKITWIGNLQKAISLSKGRYIIFHGDDDYMKNSNALKHIYKHLTKNNYGFIRANYLSVNDKTGKIFNFNKDNKFLTNKSLNPNLGNYEIIKFLEKVDPFFLTGIILKQNKKNRLINSELIPWIDMLIGNIKESGGFFISKYLFFARWIDKDKNPNHPFFYIKEGKFSFEKYLLFLQKSLNKEEANEFIDKIIRELIRHFPANKYSNTNFNLIKGARRVIQLRKKFLYSFSFWFWLVSSLLIPKLMLKFMKRYSLNKIVREGSIGKNII